jgi:hypothetical protein
VRCVEARRKGRDKLKKKKEKKRREREKGRKGVDVSLSLLSPLLSSPLTSGDDRNRSSSLNHGLMGRGPPDEKK